MGKAEMKKSIFALATELLDKTRLDDFLSFVQFAKDNKFSISRKSSYSWTISYKKRAFYHLTFLDMKIIVRMARGQ